CAREGLTVVATLTSSGSIAIIAFDPARATGRLHTVPAADHARRILRLRAVGPDALAARRGTIRADWGSHARVHADREWHPSRGGAAPARGHLRALHAPALGALRHKGFRLLWIGSVFSNIAWWMQTFGLGWLAVELAIRDGVPERAPLYIGLVGLARALPAITFSLVAGAIVDRSDRRRVLLRTQSAAMLIVATLATLAVLGLATIGIVMVFTFLH